MLRLKNNVDYSTLDQKKVITSKDEFIRKIKSISALCLSMTITAFEDNGSLVFVNYDKSWNYSNNSVVFVYKVETDTLLEYLKQILKIRDAEGFAILKVSSANRYNLIGNPEVLDVLLSKKMIEDRGEVVFNTYPHKSKNGKIREITAPHEEIKKPLRTLNTTFQKLFDKKTSAFQVAYKKGKNVKSGALIHINNKYVFNIDLKDFYPSCKRELVKRYISPVLDHMFNRTFVEEEFLNAILINDGLFIGSPISGTLANAIVSKPATYLKNICKHYGMEFSIYADDMSFSSDKFITKDFIEKIFNLAFSEYGLSDYFRMNQKKSVGFSGCNRKITGVIINGDNKISIPRRYFRNDIRVALNKLANGDTSVNINKLRGKIAYATAIDDSGKVLRYLNKYLNTVEQYNLCSAETLEKLAERSGK